MGFTCTLLRLGTIAGQYYWEKGLQYLTTIIPAERSIDFIKIHYVTLRTTFIPNSYNSVRRLLIKIDFVLYMNETLKTSFSFQSYMIQVPDIQEAENLKKLLSRSLLTRI